MNLAKLDKFMLILIITLASIDIVMVVIASTNRHYYDTLKIPITTLSIITLFACLIGYLVNQKYLKSED